MLAVSMLALLLSAPLATAATFGEGNTQLAVSPAFTKKLKNSRVKVKPSGGTVKAFAFQIASGSQATLAQNATGTFRHKSPSSITFTRGTRKVVISSIENRLQSTTGKLGGKVNGKFLVLADEAAGGKTIADSEFTTLTGTGIQAKLSAPAAKALNNALKLTGTKVFKKGLVLGTASFRAVRLLTIQPGSQSETRLSADYIDRLEGDCLVKQTPTRGATERLRDPNVPGDRGSLFLPVSGGQLLATSLFGMINNTGGVSLAGGKPGGQNQTQEVYDFRFIRGKNPTSASEGLIASASALMGNDLKIADLDETGATVTKTLTPTGGTITFNGVVIRFNEVAATVLSGNFNCQIPAGTPLGTVSLTAEVK